LIVGIAKAGVNSGAVVASILQRDFASVAITRSESGARPVVIAGPPRMVTGRRVLMWTKPAIPARRSSWPSPR